MSAKKVQKDRPLNNMEEAVLNIMNAARLLGLERMTVDQIHNVVTLIDIFKDGIAPKPLTQEKEK